MAVNRIEAFQTAFRNLQLQPLISPEEISNFRVEYGDEWLDDLEQKVLDCSDYNNQLFFAGHRGCGKSTLLAEFGQRLDDRYFTVFFSIADLIEMSAIDHINILFAIAVQMTAKADDDNIEIEQSKMDGFFNWFKERTLIEESTTKGSSETGFDLFGLIKLKLQTDNTVRDKIKTKFTKNPRDLIDTLNLIATEVALACGKEIVVIIDDLDKLELSDFEKIFKQNLKILLEPNFIVIYTIPIATIRDGVLKKHIEDAISNRIFVMPVLKIYAQGDSHQQNPQMVPAATDKLCEILRKRIDSDLLPADIALQVGAFSGGVMRELIRIAQECCRLMLVQLRQKQRRQESIDDLQIDAAILNQALDILRNEMTITLSKTDREILKKPIPTIAPTIPNNKNFSICSTISTPSNIAIPKAGTISTR
jgi:nucleoside-triphosphatase THEP1